MAMDCNDCSFMCFLTVAALVLAILFSSMEEDTDKNISIVSSELENILSNAPELDSLIEILSETTDINTNHDSNDTTLNSESKQVLQESIKWQHSLYKNNTNAIEKVQNIVKTLETESKKEIKKHETYADVKEAKQLTDEIMSKKTGNINDKNTLFQVLKEMSPNAMFYDPKVKTQNQELSTGDEYDKPKAVLKLSNVPGLEITQNNSKVNQENLVKAQKQLISEMKYSLNDTNNPHPIIVKTKADLAESLGVDIDQIIITNVYYGSCCFEYTIKDSAKYGNTLKDPNTEEKLKLKFKYFESNKVHPSFFEIFNINDFDHRGNKHFGSGSIFEVGPPGKTEKYEQPTGYTRYGLNVLNGKYGDDHTWLDPFQHANNWYRAYHGVKDGLPIAKVIRDGGFLPGTRQECQNHADIYDGKPLGIGVYCTPKISIAELYSSVVSLTLNDGTTKNFRFIFQVCVDPKQIRRSSSSDGYWVAPNNIGMVGSNTHVEDNIRPYGILMKEI